MDNKEIEKKICEVLDKIRPYLENDGGSVKFNRYENGVAYVTLVGACSNCPLASVTLEDGIESALINEIPEIVDMGIESLKIEGRLKTEYYIASVVSAYRTAIDDYIKDPENYNGNKYLKELEIVRKHGYAIDNEEELTGVICIGSPIFNYIGYPCGAIWISGPKDRLSKEVIRSSAACIKKIALEISEELGYSKR